MAEGIKEFSVSALVDRILKYKNKGALIEALTKLNKNTLNDLSYCELYLTPIYEIELKKQMKIKKNEAKKKIKYDEILSALYKLDQLSVDSSNIDINYCKVLIDDIKNKKIDMYDHNNIIEINKKLTKTEKNSYLFSLYASYAKGSFYNYLLEHHATKDNLTKEFGIKIRMLNYYLTFHSLLEEYPSLLYLELTFTKIVQNMTTIKGILSTNENMKDKCREPLK
ncbi:unnamed protein product [Rotaria socialis]|uniref:Uncharacterized protein n=1 Tax=Rotaria socialis TaxID=392032 RepID=A0A818EHP5_9BILA|nr:unnamed protein product [Rotaria socialis]CAF4923360.1 unnamed protein product [Rotaria socialis]